MCNESASASSYTSPADTSFLLHDLTAAYLTFRLRALHLLTLATALIILILGTSLHTAHTPWLYRVSRPS